MKATRVHPANIGLIWGEVEPYIEAAFFTELCDEDPKSIKKDIFAGRVELWIVQEHGRVLSAALTRINTTPANRRVCFLVAVGGSKLERWLDCIEDIENFARDYGCHEVRLSGRNGWKRLLKSRGYIEPYVILTKVL